jgi:hypothetical protein
VVLFSFFAAACYAESQPSAQRACSADEVLRAISAVLTTGDERALREVTLRADDLVPRETANSDAARTVREKFDRETLEDVTSAVIRMKNRYRGLRLLRVERGIIDRHVKIEGIDLTVDQMRNSKIVFERDGKEVVLRVAILVSTGSCWKIEHLGTGIADNAREHTLRPPEGTGFRRFAHDFCSGLAIYASPAAESKIGVLVEGYRKYRDPKTRRVFETVLLRSLSTGHVRGVWMSLEQLAATYVNRSDHAIEDCKWSTRDEEVAPLMDETLAKAPR